MQQPSGAQRQGRALHSTFKMPSACRRRPLAPLIRPHVQVHAQLRSSREAAAVLEMQGQVQLQCQVQGQVHGQGAQWMLGAQAVQPRSKPSCAVAEQLQLPLVGGQARLSAVWPSPQQMRNWAALKPGKALRAESLQQRHHR